MPTTQSTVHARLIVALGGNVRVGKALGRDHTTVSRWRVNGIPPLLWPAFARLAGRHGIEIFADQIAVTSPRFGRGGRSQRRVPLDGFVADFPEPPIKRPSAMSQ
jgi:hypothetical protein